MKVNSFLPGLPDELEISLTPRPDQIEDIHTLLQNPRVANYSQVGTGKSLVSYLYIAKKYFEGKGVLIVMPPPLIPQYIRNMGMLTLNGEPLSSLLCKRLHEDRKKRHEIMDQWDAENAWPDVLVMSYQLYTKYFKSFMKVPKYKVLIADEAHAVSNAGTKGFANMFMHVYSRDLDLLLMTATPTTTELVTAYGQIKLRNPVPYNSLREFERLHCIYDKQKLSNDKVVPVIVGYRDIDKINEHLMAGAVRRRARDVLSLESLTVIDHQVVLSKAHAELYRTLLEQWMLEMGDEVIVARNKQALRQSALQLITNVGKYSVDPIDDEPMANLRAIMDSIDLKSTKLLIFCNFQDTVRKLAAEFSELNPALVYGGSDTAKEVNKLLTDATCRIGVLNFQSGGAGFNLQDVAHHIVIYEAIGSPGMVEQGIGRAYRGGQKEPVIVWIFRYSKTMSTRLFKKNFARAEDIKQSLSDSECFVDFLVPAVPEVLGNIETIRKELGL